MNQARSEPLPGKLTHDRAIDRVAHDFEQALRRGESPRIEDAIVHHSDLGDDLVKELLATELEHRLLHDLSIDWPAYESRFPQQASHLAQLRIDFEKYFAPGPIETSRVSEQESIVASSGANGQPDSANVEMPHAPLDLSDYELQSQLGKGGQGDVYLARQKSLDRPVAVKMLLKATCDDTLNVQRFLREARTLAQTRHPHIVTIHGIGRLDEGGYFLVMEHIAGADLAKQIRLKSFPPQDAARIVRQIASAIEHAHQRGVIHRDLKPSNVLWDDLRGPVVTDFGLAKDLLAEEELTITEQVMGTPAYMAPEQASRRFGPVSAQTDVYGLGATLFALLTGQPPYASGSILEILQQLTGDDPPPDPRTLRPEIPPELSLLCRRALAHQPAQRFASMKEFGEALDRWLSGKPLERVDEPVTTTTIHPREDQAAESPNLLHSVWDSLDAELQDAFALAYNKKRRTGSTRISTQDLFQALGRLGTGPMRQLIESLPQGALPEPADASIPTDRAVLRERPLLSDCVHDSLTEFSKAPSGQIKVAPIDLFVDVAKHGHGPSVVRLREHGVDPHQVERIVEKLGLRVVRREAFAIQHSDSELRDRVWDDNVQFSVYRPKTIQPRVWERLLVFAHLSELPPDAAPHEIDPLEDVRRQAEQVLGERLSAFDSRTADSTQAIPRAGELTLVPHGEGLEFNPPSRTFRWLEPVHREEFRFRAAAHLDGQMARGRLSVFLGSILIAEVNLVTRVDRQASLSPEHKLARHNRAFRFRRIYACVAPEDGPIAEQFRRYAATVRDRFLMSQLATNRDVFGEAEQQVIRSADVFQLYWSNNAMGSRALERHWRYALSLQRPEFIRSLYWEEPFPRSAALPPPELMALGFQKIPVQQPAEFAGMSREIVDLKAIERSIHGKLESVCSPRAHVAFDAIGEPPYLEILSGPDQGRVLRLVLERITIGRHPECDLPLATTAASRFHAQLLKEEGRWLVEDLKSQNGVFLNGNRVQGRTSLVNGDKLHVADVLIAFRDSSAQAMINDLDVDDVELLGTMPCSAPIADIAEPFVDEEELRTLDAASSEEDDAPDEPGPPPRASVSAAAPMPSFKAKKHRKRAHTPWLSGVLLVAVLALAIAAFVWLLSR